MGCLPADWVLTAQRAAVHRPTATAVIADLHLGYGHARVQNGEAIPAADLDEAVAPLAALSQRHGVRRLVAAGDLFESAWNGTLLAEWLQRLESIGLALVGVVPGNHDRGIDDSAVPVFPGGLLLGSWTVVHGHLPLPTGPVIMGHVHPCVRWPGGPAAPCFLVRDNRIVLPAFSADAAGANVRGKECWSEYECHVIAGNGVLEIGLVEKLTRRRWVKK